MIKALSALFDSKGPETDDDTAEHRQHLAAAALLIETARADFTQDGVEEASMTEMLKRGLGLSDEEVADLLRLANEEVDAATSLYQFTRTVNDHFTPEQKTGLITDMWRVAYADGDIDKYEEHLIRRVADLIYVAHEDYIRAKLTAAGDAD